MTTSSKSPFVIGEIEGYSKDFSTLISMMDYTRETTIRAVQNLSVEALDFRINGTVNRNAACPPSGNGEDLSVFND